MGLLDWVVDHLSSDEIIDGYFILSDLKDIQLTEFERAENAALDAAASAAGDGDQAEVPMGKRVY